MGMENIIKGIKIGGIDCGFGFFFILMMLINGGFDINYRYV